jgi:hypothetical protein
VARPIQLSHAFDAIHLLKIVLLSRDIQSNIRKLQPLPKILGEPCLLEMMELVNAVS